MKKFMNTADDFLKESLQGFEAAHQDIVSVYYDPNFITRSQPTTEGKVALISGGGSGHEPMHGGLVGHGMLDAACPGFVFSSPTPDQMLAATVLVEKIVGSLAESGGTLQECKALGDKVNQNSGSMGVAFSSCTVPAAGKPTFELGVDEMEFGVGIHGEPGRRRDKIKPAQDITNELLEAIIEDLKPNSNEETLLFVNGMGGTPLTELYLVFDNAKKLLDSKNIKISRSLVGNYCTSLEMQGASITLTKLDEEIAKHWDSKVHTAAMRWGM